MQKLQSMSQKLENSLKTFKDTVSEFIKSIREIGNPPIASYEILVLNRKTRISSREKFFKMKDAMSYVTPQYLYDTENEYYLLDIGKEQHKCIQLNKISKHGQNERNIHAKA
jgi:hypothetical protein